jgi:hypothetical protein
MGRCYAKASQNRVDIASGSCEMVLREFLSSENLLAVIMLWEEG